MWWVSAFSSSSPGCLSVSEHHKDLGWWGQEKGQKRKASFLYVFVSLEHRATESTEGITFKDMKPLWAALCGVVNPTSWGYFDFDCILLMFPLSGCHLNPSREALHQRHWTLLPHAGAEDRRGWTQAAPAPWTGDSSSGVWNDSFSSSHCYWAQRPPASRTPPPSDPSRVHCSPGCPH